MKLTFITNVDPNDPMFRSSNWILLRKTVYITGYLKFDSGWSFYSYNYSDKNSKKQLHMRLGMKLLRHIQDLLIP